MSGIPQPYSIREVPSEYDAGWFKTEHQNIQRAIAGAWADSGVFVVRTSADLTAALASCRTQGGGRVQMKPGSYMASASANQLAFSVPNNTWVDGIWKEATTIKLSPNQPNGVAAIGSDTGATRVRISNLTVDGDRNNQTNGQFGIKLIGATKFVLDYVRVTNTKSHGMNITTNCADGLVLNPVVETWGFGAGEGFGIVAIDGATRIVIWNPYVSGFGSGSVGIAFDGSLDDGTGSACEECRVVMGYVTGCATGYLNEDSHRTHWVDCVAEAWTNIAFENTPGQANRMPIGMRNVRPILRNGAATDGVGIYDIGNDTKIIDPQGYNVGNSRFVKRALAPLALRPSYGFKCTGAVQDGGNRDALFAEEGRDIEFSNFDIRNLTGGSAVNLVPAAAMTRVKVGGRSFVSTLTNLVANTGGVQVTGGVSTLTKLDIEDIDLLNIGVSAAQDAVSIVTGGTVDKVRVRKIRASDDQGAPTTRNAVNILGAITTIKVDDIESDGITGALVATDTPANQIGGVSQNLSATVVWDPPNVVAGAQTTTTITVTGAALGDPVDLGFSLDLQGMELVGYVSSANTVTGVLKNGTAGALDLASGTLRADVRHH